MVDSCVNTK